MKKADAVDELDRQLRRHGWVLLREYHFAPEVDGEPIRKWRLDLAAPASLQAIEVDGGLATGGRHGGSPAVFRDLEKRNAAAVMGWRVLHVTPSQVRGGEALQWARAFLGAEPMPV